MIILPFPSGGIMARQEKINLNTADIDDLQKVAGLGHTRAQYILEHRPYNNVGMM
jgi:DNA uptake protein ComE-like DNA-binding protein